MYRLSTHMYRLGIHVYRLGTREYIDLPSGVGLPMGTEESSESGNKVTTCSVCHTGS